MWRRSAAFANAANSGVSNSITMANADKNEKSVAPLRLYGRYRQRRYINGERPRKVVAASRPLENKALPWDFSTKAPTGYQKRQKTNLPTHSDATT